MKNKNYGAATEKLANRRGSIVELGGDTTHTDNMFEMMGRGQYSKLERKLQVMDDVAVIEGLDPYPKKAGDEYLGMEGNQAIFLGDDGPYTTQIKGISEIEEQLSALDIAKTEETRAKTGKLIAETDILTSGSVDKEKIQPKIDKHRTAIKDITKDYRKVETAYEKIRQSAKRGTAAGDMSMIFGIMKINDPGSTVREGEYATAEQAAGLPARILNFYHKAIDGQKLSAAQRADFMEQAKLLYGAQRGTADNQIENILQQVDADELDRARVFGTDRLKDFNTRRNNPTMMSSRLGRKISIAELHDTARETGKTPQQVMQDMGIE
jgi:hypothetical protein